MTAPTLLWIRREYRLADHPALAAAMADGGPVIPVVVMDPVLEGQGGAAPRWRLGEAIRVFAESLGALGARLILRRGDAAAALAALARETGAKRVRWTRAYDAPSAARDAATAQALSAHGIASESHPGALLFEPDAVRTQSGGMFKVYTPFWRSVSAGPPPSEPEPAPTRWPAPEAWPESEALADWALGADMRRGASVVARSAVIGEAAARRRLDAFLEARVARYAEDRDRLDRPGTSRLSENLAVGEIGPRTIWRAGRRAMETVPGAGAGGETFLKEIVWREFAWHLMQNTPHLAEANWRAQWDGFPWRGDTEDAERWRRGLTGVDVVDAAMRELYVTGVMHNRARMLVASYLTKNLMTHWRVGADWFRDCLIDWDPASNAMGWQWAAGSGPDAAPFFRVFNPETQAAKFDPDGVYVSRWLPEARARTDLFAAAPAAEAIDGSLFFDARPRSWPMTPDDPRPAPALSLADGRKRALDAYQSLTAATRAAEASASARS